MRKLISLQILSYQDDEELKSLLVSWLEFWEYYRQLTSRREGQLLVIDEGQNKQLLEQSAVIQKQIITRFQQGYRVSLDTIIQTLNLSKQKVYHIDNECSAFVRDCFYLYYAFSTIDRDYLLSLSPSFSQVIENIYPQKYFDFTDFSLINGTWDLFLDDSGISADELHQISDLINEKVKPVFLYLREKAIADYQQKGAVTVFSSKVAALLEQYLWLPEYHAKDNKNQLFRFVEEFSVQRKPINLFGHPFIHSKDFIDYAEFKKYIDEGQISFEIYHSRQQMAWKVISVSRLKTTRAALNCRTFTLQSTRIIGRMQ